MTHHALAAVADMTEQDLERCLREALARHVLVRTDEGAYAFRHALMREATYDGLLVSERERLHRGLARALDAIPISSAAAPSELLADRAHHWYHAGDESRALRSAIQAGLAADEVYAHAEALTLYERALELWNQVDDPERLAGIDGIALRARAAQAASFLGEPLRAAHMVERALEDLDPAAEPVRAGLLRERLGRYLWIGGDTAYALAAYEEAVRVIPSTPASAERARTLAALAHAQLIANRYRIAQQLCEQALDVAREAEALTEEGRALATLGAAMAELGDRPAGLTMVREGRTLLERAEASPDHLFVTYSYEAGALADGGELDAAIDAARPGIELMRRHGMYRSHQSWLEGMLAHALIKLGRWSEATALLDAAIARGPVGITRRMLQLQRAEVQLGRGALAAASDAVAQAREAAEGDHPFASKLFELNASLAACGGDFAAARLTVARGIATLDDLDDVQASARLRMRGIAVEADRAERARAHGHKPEAAAAVGAAEGLFEQVHTLGELPTARSLSEFPAIELTCAAEEGRATGRAAADPWLEAAAAWESLHQPYPRACCLARAAETALTDRRRRADIAAWLGCAYEIASELGAAPLPHAVESIAQRGRVPISRHSPPPPSRPEPPRSASPPARSTFCGSSPRATPTPESLTRYSSAARPPARTSRTSSGNSRSADVPRLPRSQRDSACSSSPPPRPPHRDTGTAEPAADVRPQLVTPKTPARNGSIGSARIR
jgi:tetratricopeptide (TPR) repeat protein